MPTTSTPKSLVVDACDQLRPTGSQVPEQESLLLQDRPASGATAVDAGTAEHPMSKARKTYIPVLMKPNE